MLRTFVFRTALLTFVLVPASNNLVNANCWSPCVTYYPPVCWPIYIPCQPIFIPCPPPCPKPQCCLKPQTPCEVELYGAWNGVVRVGPPPSTPGSDPVLTGKILNPDTLNYDLIPEHIRDTQISDPNYAHFKNRNDDHWAVARFPNSSCLYSVWHRSSAAGSWKLIIWAERKCGEDLAGLTVSVKGGYGTKQKPQRINLAEIRPRTETFQMDLRSPTQAWGASILPSEKKRPLNTDIPLIEEENDDAEKQPADRLIVDRRVPRTRIGLRSDWGVPAETKIVAKWSDGVSAKPLAVVQELPQRRSNHDLKDKEVILVTGFENIRGE